MYGVCIVGCCPCCHFGINPRFSCWRTWASARARTPSWVDMKGRRWLECGHSSSWVAAALEHGLRWDHLTPPFHRRWAGSVFPVGKELEALCLTLLKPVKTGCPSRHSSATEDRIGSKQPSVVKTCLVISNKAKSPNSSQLTRHCSWRIYTVYFSLVMHSIARESWCHQFDWFICCIIEVTVVRFEPRWI